MIRLNSRNVRSEMATISYCRNNSTQKAFIDFGLNVLSDISRSIVAQIYLKLWSKPPTDESGMKFLVTLRFIWNGFKKKKIKMKCF